MRRFANFSIVGMIGFLADAAVLAALAEWSAFNPFLARLLSMAVALCATWMLNRTFTFGASSRPVAVEGARYGGIGAVSGVLNYVVYSAVILLAPTTHPLLALVVGSAVAMMFSYIGYSRLVFDR